MEILKTGISFYFLISCFKFFLHACFTMYQPWSNIVLNICLKLWQANQYCPQYGPGGLRGLRTLIMSVYLIIYICRFTVVSCGYYACLLFLKTNFIYLLRAVLDLHRYVGFSLSLLCAGFSSWWLLLFQSTDSRACGLQQLQRLGSGAHTQQLWYTGLL